MLQSQKHSETSREAAQKNTKAPSQKHRIFNAIKNNYGVGLCAFELCNVFKIHPGTMAARLRDLEKVRKIVKTNRTRRNPITKMKQSVYVIPAYAAPDEIIEMKPRTINEEMNGFLVQLKRHIEQYKSFTMSTESATYKALCKLLK